VRGTVWFLGGEYEQYLRVRDELRELERRVEELNQFEKPSVEEDSRSLKDRIDQLHWKRNANSKAVS
jgi:hypothetical protein